MITLPDGEDLSRCLWRVLVSDNWTTWTVLPYPFRSQTPGGEVNGYEVLRVQRSVFPRVAQASFRRRFGHIDGVVYDPVALEGKYVRIQCSQPIPLRQSTPPVAPVWRTWFLGTVEYYQDNGAPGATDTMGERVYHCLDLTALFRRWLMQTHAFLFAGQSGAAVCRGNPGYNLQRTDGTLGGNRATTAAIFTGDQGALATFAHTLSGQGAFWTDAQVVAHALASSRTAGQPLITLTDAGDWLSGVSLWPVRDGQTCFQFLEQILRRERGLGTAFLDWADDSAAPTAAIAPTLRVLPQSAGDVPVATGVTLRGASSLGTAVAVDLIGDHRVLPDGFSLATRYQSSYDYVETQSEYLQVLVTVGMATATLQARWDLALPATFAALTDPIARQAHTFDALYQLYSVPVDGLPLAEDPSALGGASRYDYQCAADGSLVVDSLGTGSVRPCSPVTVTWLTDTPDPFVSDGKTGRTRGSALVLLTGTTSTTLVNAVKEVGASVSVRPDGIYVTCGGDAVAGGRTISSRTAPAIPGARYDATTLHLTITAQLPHRIRRATGDPTTAKRSKLVTIPGLRLWLAHPGAVRGLDLTAGVNWSGYAPIRFTPGAAPLDPSGAYLLVDDRARLARYHALAVAWFGSERRNGKWQLRTHGVGSFTASKDGDDPAPIAYPTLGQVVTTLAANGETHTTGTPITDIAIDVPGCTTAWTTDWADLDLR